MSEGKKTLEKKKASLEQKEWIIPCNTNYYDLEGALRALKIIDWKQPKQMNNAQVGDLVYIYCKTKGEGSICYKGAILEINKTRNIIDDSRYSSDGQIAEGPCFSVAVFRVYEIEGGLTYSKLKSVGLKSRLQGPTIVRGTVADYLHECDIIQRNADRFMGDIPDVCLYDFPIKIHEITSVSGTSAPNQTALDDTHTDDEKVKHAEMLDIYTLKKIAIGQQKKLPKEIKTTFSQKVRDPYIAEYAKRRANGVCQLCGCAAPFNRKDGEPYLESHHIKWLSEGGEDTIANTVALCPNCHRKMHVVGDAADVEKLMKANEMFE